MPLTNFGFKKIRMIFVDHVIGKRLAQSHLIKNPTNRIPQSISFNLDMTRRIQIPKNWSLGKSFLLVYKGFFSSDGKKNPFQKHWLLQKLAF